MKFNGEITKIDTDIRTRTSLLTILLESNINTWLGEQKSSHAIVEIKGDKRSLNANAMAWALIQEIAKSVGITKEEVYRDLIRNVGDFELIPIKEEAVDKFCNAWSKNGVGWVTETTTSKLKGFKNVLAYYGTSTYDKKQMSRFIDAIIQECDSLGIPVNENEMQSLIQTWEGE
jgi:hypothetical protein